MKRNGLSSGKRLGLAESHDYSFESNPLSVET